MSEKWGFLSSAGLAALLLCALSLTSADAAAAAGPVTPTAGDTTSAATPTPVLPTPPVPATTAGARLAAALPTDGRVVPVYPTRVLDTRSGVGAPAELVPAGGSVTLQLVGRPPYPQPGASAVVLDLTVDGATATGYVTAYPAGTAEPLSATLIFTGPAPVSGLSVVPLSADGAISIHNNSTGTLRLVADLTAYVYSGAPAPTNAGPLVATRAARILDTKTGLGAPAGLVPPGGTVTLRVAGRGPVPSQGAASVLLTLYVDQATAAGYLQTYPDAIGSPSTSAITFSAGQPVANLSLTAVLASGNIVIRNGSTGPVRIIADVSGYTLDSSQPGRGDGALVAVTPSRLLDTRSGIGTRVGLLGPGASVTVQVSGRGGVPASGATAAFLDVVVDSPSASGLVTTYPAGVTAPNTTTVAFSPRQTVGDLALVPLGTSGAVVLRNGSPGTVHFVVDVTGYTLAAPS